MPQSKAIPTPTQPERPSEFTIYRDQIEDLGLFNALVWNAIGLGELKYYGGTPLPNQKRTWVSSGALLSMLDFAPRRDVIAALKALVAVKRVVQVRHENQTWYQDVLDFDPEEPLCISLPYHESVQGGEE